MNLSFYKQFGFRWRTENEVVSGKGMAQTNIILILSLYTSECLFFMFGYTALSKHYAA